MNHTWLKRASALIFLLGVVLFGFGVLPGGLELDLTPGIGILQIVIFLFGITVMTLGASVYMYATRHRVEAPRLREDVGIRFMATGVVVAYVTGLADVLGIGSNFGVERPVFGLLQMGGVALGCLIIVIGIAIYSHR